MKIWHDKLEHCVLGVSSKKWGQMCFSFHMRVWKKREEANMTKGYRATLVREKTIVTE